MIRTLNLTKEFLLKNGERLLVLDNINLNLPEGKSIAIVGQSGSGKTTLLSLLAGLDSPSAGSVEVAGNTISALNEEKLSRFRAQHIGIVFQNFQLLKHFSAVANVSVAAHLAGVDNPSDRSQEVLAEVGLGHRVHHLPTRLSGGECQRVAIARALVAKPKLLLCDEPTGNLDPETAEQILALLWQVKQKLGTTLVIVTHDFSIAQRCDVVVKLNKGRLIGVEGLIS